MVGGGVGPPSSWSASAACRRRLRPRRRVRCRSQGLCRPSEASSSNLPICPQGAATRRTLQCRVPEPGPECVVWVQVSTGKGNETLRQRYSGHGGSSITFGTPMDQKYSNSRWGTVERRAMEISIALSHTGKFATPETIAYAAQEAERQ